MPSVYIYSLESSQGEEKPVCPDCWLVMYLNITFREPLLLYNHIRAWQFWTKKILIQLSETYIFLFSFFFVKLQKKIR